MHKYTYLYYKTMDRRAEVRQQGRCREARDSAWVSSSNCRCHHALVKKTRLHLYPWPPWINPPKAARKRVGDKGCSTIATGVNDLLSFSLLLSSSPLSLFSSLLLACLVYLAIIISCGSSNWRFKIMCNLWPGDWSVSFEENAKCSQRERFVQTRQWRGTNIQS